MTANLEKFNRGIGSRIDALDSSSSDLAIGSEASTNVRRVARTIAESAQACNLEPIVEAAQAVQSCSREDLQECVDTLIDLLRKTAAENFRAISTQVLAIGPESKLMQQAAKELHQEERHTVHRAKNDNDAWDILEQKNIALMMLDAEFASDTGEEFLLQLRENPISTSIPTLLVVLDGCDSDREAVLAPFADGVIRHPETADDIREWVNQHSHRIHDTVSPCRRDMLTGLLDRATFTDMVDESLKQLSQLGGSPALGVLRIDNFESANWERDTSILVTQGVGLRLASAFRPKDIVGRISPDTFAAFFPNEDEFGIKKGLSRALEGIASATFINAGGGPLEVTLSGAIFHIDPDRGTSAGLERAEEMLERAGPTGTIFMESVSPLVQPSRICIMSPSDITFKVLKSLFERGGHKAVRIADRDSAIKQITGPERIDMLIIDGDLPDEEGFVTLESVTELPESERMPVLMLLSPPHERNIMRALELGARDYFMRPFAPDVFASRVQRLLSKRRSPGTETGNNRPDQPRLLVVGNNNAELVLLGSAIQHAGAFEVYLAMGEEDARLRAAEINPDIVLLPCKLETLNGAQLLKQIVDEMQKSEVEAVLIADRPEDRDTPLTGVSLQVKGIVNREEGPREVCKKIQHLFGLIPSAAPPSSHALNCFAQELRRLTGL